jgi:uncharacterized protein YraI
MKALHILAAATIAITAVGTSPASAAPANAYTTVTTAERAGPGTRYPVVAYIPAGASIRVYGCVAGAAWCDVSWRGDRGWVRGSSIQVVWRGKRNPVASFYRQLGIPIIVFGFGDYWNDHYRSKPFFKDRGNYNPRPDKPRDHKPGPNQPIQNQLPKLDKKPGDNKPISSDRSDKVQPPKFGKPDGNDKPCRPGQNEDCRPRNP